MAGAALCAICSPDPDTGQPGGTNATTRICKACKADPANADWDDRQWDLGSRIDVAECTSYRLTTLMADVQSSLPDATEREGRVLSALRTTVTVRVQVRDNQGRRRGYRKKERALTIREVAHYTNTSKSYVWGVYAKRVRGR